MDNQVGRNLANVGLFDDGVRLFEDLNSALEFCENDLLKEFYRQRDALIKDGRGSDFLGT